MQYIGGGGSGCTMAEAVAAADKLSGATLPPSGNRLPLRGLKMAVAEALAAAGDPTGHRSYPLVCIHCGPVVDFFITKQTSLHPFDFVINLFHLLYYL